MDKYERYLQEVRRKRKEEEEEELERWNRENPDQQIGEDRLPLYQSKKVTGNSITTTRNDHKSLLQEFLGGYLDKGALNGGVSAGNLAKTILGTGFDIAGDARESILGMGESILDTGASAIRRFLPEDKQGKITDFIQRDLVGEFSSDRNIMSMLPGSPDLKRINNRWNKT